MEISEALYRILGLGAGFFLGVSTCRSRTGGRAVHCSPFPVGKGAAVSIPNAESWVERLFSHRAKHFQYKIETIVLTTSIISKLEH